MMRAARFTSQLVFTPAPRVIAAMTAMADRIAIVSAERVRDELSKLLLTDRPRAGLELLVHTGLADRVLPELPALRLERDEHHRHKDVYEHSLTVLEQAIDLESRLPGAAGPGQSGWPRCCTTSGSRPPGSSSRAARCRSTTTTWSARSWSKKRLTALRFTADEITAVSRLIELHLRFHGYGEGQWTDSAVRRYVRDAGDQLDRLHVLTRADCTTRNKAKADRLRRAYDELEARIDELAAEEEIASIRPDLDGTQIMAILGIAPGREVGEAYRFLLERRIDEGPLGPERAEEALRTWWAARAS